MVPSSSAARPFDYVVDRDTVRLSVSDAMGHDVAASLLATLVVGALRRVRRAGESLQERARQADLAMREHGREGYVTGQLLRISLLDGATEFINAGHPWPLRMRDGPEIDLPFGILSRVTIGCSHWTCGPATDWRLSSPGSRAHPRRGDRRCR